MHVNQDYSLCVDLGQTGLEEVDLEIKTPETESFQAFVVDETNFKEVGLGYYCIEIPRELTKKPGTYLFHVSGYELNEVFEREAYLVPLSSSPPPEVCVITGNVRDIGAAPRVFDNIQVTIRPLKLPKIVDGTLTLGRRITALTDYDGFFSIPAIKGSMVIVEIEKAGVRFQAEIPDQETIRIEDLIPQ